MAENGWKEEDKNIMHWSSIHGFYTKNRKIYILLWFYYWIYKKYHVESNGSIRDATDMKILADTIILYIWKPITDMLADKSLTKVYILSESPDKNDTDNRQLFIFESR